MRTIDIFSISLLFALTFWLIAETSKNQTDRLIEESRRSTQEIRKAIYDLEFTFKYGK